MIESWTSWEIRSNYAGPAPGIPGGYAGSNPPPLESGKSTFALKSAVNFCFEKIALDNQKRRDKNE